MYSCVARIDLGGSVRMVREECVEPLQLIPVYCGACEIYEFVLDQNKNKRAIHADWLLFQKLTITFKKQDPRSQEDLGLHVRLFVGFENDDRRGYCLSAFFLSLASDLP